MTAERYERYRLGREWVAHLGYIAEARPAHAGFIEALEAQLLSSADAPEEEAIEGALWSLDELIQRGLLSLGRAESLWHLFLATGPRESSHQSLNRTLTASQAR